MLNVSNKIVFHFSSLVYLVSSLNFVCFIVKVDSSLNIWHTEHPRRINRLWHCWNTHAPRARAFNGCRRQQQRRWKGLLANFIIKCKILRISFADVVENAQESYFSIKEEQKKVLGFLMIEIGKYSQDSCRIMVSRVPWIRGIWIETREI